MKKLALLLLPVLIPSLALAQNENPSRYRINALYLSSGYYSSLSNYGSLEDFNTLMPNSTLLKEDYDQYESSGETILYLDAGQTFNMMVGLEFLNKDRSAYRSNPQLRLGFSYLSGASLYADYYREDRYPVDTLSSSRTGRVEYLDSVDYGHIGMEHWQEEIHLDVSLIFRTDPEARWSLFAGMGFSVGAAINSRTSIWSNYYNYIESRNDDGYSGIRQYNDDSYDYQEEVRYTNGGWGATVYVPLGVDFRVGKKRDFWKPIHLYYEMRPWLKFTSVPDLRTLTNSGSMQSLGLRVTW